ncbi:glycosyl hydrolase [Bacteroides fluxus]|uniref:glycosyl hydrolase n=1 Tax=Bacteroides fluxus TaxID=626930 RepID=UPI00235365C7|nr:glycosyl hydrolase [Bacteroides fluxus]
MKKRYRMVALCLCLSLVFMGCKQTADTMEVDFKTPPEQIQTSVYWYWIAGNVSEEGVVKDLHAMKQAGINRAFIGCIGNRSMKSPYPKVAFGSEEWWKVLHTALKTATELGIEIGIFNSPGWSQSGGPWVKPGQAMRYLTSVSRQVSGGRKINITLEKPADDFQDVKVIAFPATEETAVLSSGKVVLPQASGKAAVIDFSAAEDFTLRSIRVYPSAKAIQANVRLSVKEGNGYRELAEFQISRFNAALNVGFEPYAPVVVSVPATVGRNFRLELEQNAERYELENVELLSQPLVERYPEKLLAKMYQKPLPYWHEYQWRDQPVLDDASLAVDPDRVLDISSSLHGDNLEWDVPAGNWIVMRMGMRPTGVKNSPADPEATGLETDKMSRKHVEAHFEAFMGEICRRIPEADRKSWKVVVQDSYETGGQNFTDDFLASFRQRYGYDPLPFLPVYKGYVVESQDRTDRFLWDMRRLIADRIAYDYVGGLRDVSHKYGLHTWLENYGHWGFPGEFLQYGGQSDEIGGEFWSLGELGDIENRAASSCGHIYGKNKISAESFTSGGRPFTCYPAAMKRRGDRFFTEGINNTLLHVYISQPSDERVPGINASFSSEFNRLNTWYPQLDLFTSYLKRVNYMLQQGINVADVAYFIGEDAPKMTGVTEPALPEGYQFDYINAEVIERDLFVKDGLLTLPHGTQYRILVLPELKTMRPELLAKIKQLLHDGAVVLGPAPERSPSGQNYGEADRQVRALAAELWNGLDGKRKKMSRIGKGLLMVNMDMAEALAAIGCVPDCKFPEDVQWLYGHRNVGRTEIYFISNQENKEVTASPEFRVQRMQPELWSAIDGKIRSLPAYRQTDTGTVVPLKLHPYESVFIVFRKSGGKPVGDLLAQNFPNPKVCSRIDKPWKLTFCDTLRGPKGVQTYTVLEDLSQSDREPIRYYSGTIVYETDFTFTAKPEGCIYLNLNRVGVMAKVKVNGRYAGGVWTSPYRVEVTDLVKNGENHLEVEVVTTWQNRLIGDSGLPESERSTWIPVNNWTIKDSLQPSGLMGPVVLETENYLWDN